jgi:large subunit ribosomal protein L29
VKKTSEGRVKVTEIRSLSHKELIAKIAEKEEELANMRFQISLHQFDNVIKVRHIRHDLARMKTILNEDVLGIHPLTGKAE